MLKNEKLSTFADVLLISNLLKGGDSVRVGTIIKNQQKFENIDNML